MIKTHLSENGKRIKCENCNGEDWVKRTEYSTSAYCAKCDLILTFKPEKQDGIFIGRKNNHIDCHSINNSMCCNQPEAQTGKA